MNISINNLEICNYRYLQKVAKSMHLPSNVKKIHLIEMIRAKSFCNKSQLEEIVERIKDERKHAGQKKKHKQIQGTEVSSTRCSISTPIVSLPRTPIFTIQKSPNKVQSMVAYGMHRQVMKPLHVQESDRILRSSNSKIRLHHSISGNNTIYDVIRNRRLSEVTNLKVYKSNVCESKKSDGQDNKTARPIQRQRRISGIYPLEQTEKPNSSCLQYIRSVGVKLSNGKMTRINAVIDKSKSKTNCLMSQPSTSKIMYTKSIINTQKCDSYLTSTSKNPKRPIIVTIQDVINDKLDSEAASNTFSSGNSEIWEANAPRTNSLLKPNVIATESGQDRGLTEVIYVREKDLPNSSTDQDVPTTVTIVECEARTDSTIEQTITRTNSTMEQTITKTNSTLEQTTAYGTISPMQNLPITDSPQQNPNSTMEQNLPSDGYKEENYSAYNQNISSDRSVSTQQTENSEVLPRINQVFSQFNQFKQKNLSQPLYVQVYENCDVSDHSLNPNKTALLESIYNIKSEFLMNQPVLQVKTTTNTKWVYNAPIVSSCVMNETAHPSTSYNFAVSEPGDEYQYNAGADDNPRLHDYWKVAQENVVPEERDGALSPCSSGDTDICNDLEANVSIKEMVDDALELISQDGDYMERLGIDGKLNCLWCEWIGPRLLFENHIRKEHSDIIVCSVGGSCRVVVPLRAACSERGAALVLQHRAALNTITARACNTLKLRLETISDIEPPSRGKITIYNKLTGKPFTWEGEIYPIPEFVSEESDYNCLELDISDLDILPNNVKLVDSELVASNNVILGKSDISNIDIVIHVEFLD